MKRVKKDWRRLRTEPELKEAYASEVKKKFEGLVEYKTDNDIVYDWNVLQKSFVKVGRANT